MVVIILNKHHKKEYPKVLPGLMVHRNESYYGLAFFPDLGTGREMVDQIAFRLELGLGVFRDIAIVFGKQQTHRLTTSRRGRACGPSRR